MSAAWKRQNPKPGQSPVCWPISAKYDIHQNIQPIIKVYQVAARLIWDEKKAVRVSVVRAMKPKICSPLNIQMNVT